MRTFIGKNLSKIGMSLFMVAVVGVGAVGFSAATSEAVIVRNCICPDVYAPVKCSNGKTYPNACVAGCNKATGCVRTGDI